MIRPTNRRKRALETADFFAERIARARCERLDVILGKAKDQPPAPGDKLPADLSARKKHYLRKTGYGRKRGR